VGFSSCTVNEGGARNRQRATAAERCEYLEFCTRECAHAEAALRFHKRICGAREKRPRKAVRKTSQLRAVRKLPCQVRRLSRHVSCKGVARCCSAE